MTSKLNQLIQENAIQGNPLEALRIFLENENKLELARKTDEMRFVGYVLDLGYDKAKIITSDPYKLAVGGIPRGSFLIMTPNNISQLPAHFTLLRVTGVSPTPLTMQVQQTYFELHKKSMPDLDIWTQGELQWGALDCDVLGMFHIDPTNSEKVAFSGDVNNVVSAHRYRVFAPDEKLLNVIINGTVKPENRFEIGYLRTMECGMMANEDPIKIGVQISMRDFKGARTAMFGKTRLGKSNVVKLIAKGMLESTAQDKTVGQLIFDINGEYANDNPQDGNKSLRSAFEDQCSVYALTQRTGTTSKPLRLNFYEQPDSSMQIIASLLALDSRTSIYITSFSNVQMPSLETIKSTPLNEKTRPIRKIQLFWAILNEAGFASDENRLLRLGLTSPNAKNFDPHFKQSLRDAAYQSINTTVPSDPSTLDEMCAEFKVINQFRRSNPDSPELRSGSKALLDADDCALLDFFNPNSGSGPTILRAYQSYHSPNAGDFINEILGEMDQGRTVILDLGNANDSIRRYFSDLLSKSVFNHQEKKFVNNELGGNYFQLYFEEAHNLFPPNNNDLTGVYARFAKEGAKFHIGMVYSTQSPSTISKELLTQTENFFVGHLSSQDETKSLSRLQIAFSGIEDDILRAKTPGYMRMLTMSHRFIVPVQAYKFEAK